ncbi:MAG: PilZ domain-containing protein [Pirellulales bacterium]|nr:PilZ domain-containing protein [Pirellulales bacterium]MBX3431931.1 PilZ domain-containing protein [Pirellulales bacterium]
MLVERDLDLNDDQWARLTPRTALPCSEAEFLAPTGPAYANNSSRRLYHRFHYRRRGVLHLNEETLAVYAKDVSRIGIGLLAPRQLFPCDQVRLELAGLEIPPLVVRRCRRIQTDCYEIGTAFEDGVLSTELYKKMIRHTWE